MVPFEYGGSAAAEAIAERFAPFVPMSQQPELISPSYSAGPASGEQAPSPEQGQIQENQTHPQQPERIPPWLVRAELYLRVLVRMYIGLFVCYLPWSSLFWDQNPFFLHFPTLGVIAANGAVRGLISGLGLLNLWIALQNALHYRGK